MAFLPMSCKNVPHSYEIRANFNNFVRLSYEFCTKSSPKWLRIRTLNVVVINFIRISCKFRTKFEQFARIFIILLRVWLCLVGGLLFVWAWVHGVCVRG